MIKLDPMLRDNVRLLGEKLGQSIRADLGDAFIARLEEIRTAAKKDRTEHNSQRLLTILSGIQDQELIPVCRAFNQFLNLANIAEQYHNVRRAPHEASIEPIAELLQRLISRGIDTDALHQIIDKLHIEFVLTAHPTEVARRTLIQKYDSISDCLRELDHSDLLDHENQDIHRRLEQLVAEIWRTDEIRRDRPSAVDEAKWGMAVIENSLWTAVPNFLRELDQALLAHSGRGLPITASPITVASWMGGDRDGNPNVTAEVTEQVLIIGRWEAADLFLKDVHRLRSDLSMQQCNAELRAIAGDHHEPYRYLLGQLRERLEATREWANDKILGQPPRAENILTCNHELLQPLLICYRSLCDCGMQTIADGPLLDTIRRANCFGLQLLKLDIRQDSDSHLQALSELTRFLELGDYGDWSEDEKQAFLLKELQSRRPLLPENWHCTWQTREVLNTCRVIAEQSPEALGAYVISMARAPSDVLAVILLLQKSGVPFQQRVVPLFETLSDLEHAADCIRHLLSIDWYYQYCNQRQQVMIGYSDSAKDAGMMAAAWAQYQAQEKLVQVAADFDVSLTLFHGRGGTVSRGGGPANRAILSQPPGSVNGTFRITEQGEMIRFRFGIPKVAEQNLGLYTGAVIEASLLPPPQPNQTWREMMRSLTADSVNAYRRVIRDDPDFVPYFRAATPEQELGKLALGSRPAKRKPTGGVESLRAIPWIFAWTQMRLMLPSWLGSDEALQHAIDQGHEALLKKMIAEWPFFSTHIDMMEMVLSKADERIVEYYESRLVPDSLKPMGQDLRRRLLHSVELVNNLKQQSALLHDNPLVAQSLQVRNPYTDPLHYLQAELLGRERSGLDSDSRLETVELALKICMAGIAAGMRNTG